MDIGVGELFATRDLRDIADLLAPQLVEPHMGTRDRLDECRIGACRTGNVHADDHLLLDAALGQPDTDNHFEAVGRIGNGRRRINSQRQLQPLHGYGAGDMVLRDRDTRQKGPKQVSLFGLPRKIDGPADLARRLQHPGGINRLLGGQ